MIDLNLDIFFSLEQQERDYGEWIKWKDKPVLWRKSEPTSKYYFYLRPKDITQQQPLQESLEKLLESLEKLLAITTDSLPDVNTQVTKILQKLKDIQCMNIKNNKKQEELIVKLKELSTEITEITEILREQLADEASEATNALLNEVIEATNEVIEATGNISLFLTNNEEKNNVHNFLYFFLIHPYQYKTKLKKYSSNENKIFDVLNREISKIIIVNFMASNMCIILDSLPDDSIIFKELISIKISEKQSYKEQEFSHYDMLCKLKIKEGDKFYFSPESLNILNSSQLIKIYENTEESLQEITTHIVKKYLEERNINPY